jgi:excinuclease ABC subunit C
LRITVLPKLLFATAFEPANGLKYIEMTETLVKKLEELPKQPGVYFHKDKAGAIIYVGKAAVLRNRVRQYFQTSRNRDPKTEALVAEIADIDWMCVDSEIEALFLEAELIRRYMPRYNILLRDDKAMSYIRIDYDSVHPTVSTTRRPLDDGARYFGPYFSVGSVRQALKLLRRVFPFSTRRVNGQKRASLHYHLGLDPGLEEGKTSLEDYRANLRKLMAVIQGRRKTILKELERDMKRAAKEHHFEQATRLRNQLFALQGLDKQVIFSDKEFLDISKDHALNELVNLLSLPKYPVRIEGYDISHQHGSDVVASMVVFTNGVSNKAEYRKFKTKLNHNNDFYNMNETLKRRLSEKNRKAWGVPSLVLIDGGKGQLDAAIAARDEMGRSLIPFIGLAKREEQIVIKKGPGLEALGASGVNLDEKLLHELGGYATETDEFILVNLPHSTNLVKLLQRIRDESHRFAVSYHTVLKAKRQTASLLEDVPGVGPATRKKLLKTFGSVRGVATAEPGELAKLVGSKKARLILQYLTPELKTAAR